MRDAGQLRERAVLQAPTGTPDGAGGMVPGWADIAKLSVLVEPLAIKAGERFGAREAVATHRVTCRHRGDVERGMALLLGARRLLVTAVRDPDERRRFLELACREET